MRHCHHLVPLLWEHVDNGSVDLLLVEDCIPDFAQVPSRLLGHVFVCHGWADDDDELFKIVDCISSDVRGLSFEVQFIGYGTSTIMVPELDLLDMVRDSMICWERVCSAGEFHRPDFIPKRITESKVGRVSVESPSRCVGWCISTPGSHGR